MMDRHDEWTERLSAFLSGDLDPATRSLVERHLAECARCTEALAELEQVVTLAREAAELEPSRDVWPGIADAIGSIPAGAQAEVIELPTAREGATAVRISRARLAAAAALLVFVSGGGGWWMASSRAEPATQPGTNAGLDVLSVAAGDDDAPPDLAAELRVLEGVVASARETLDPATVLVLERSLATIESAIADSREALASDPGNAFLREHLDRMYRRKLIYLQDVVRMAEWTG